LSWGFWLLGNRLPVAMHLHGSLWLSVHRVGGLTAPDEANNRKDILIFAILNYWTHKQLLHPASQF